MSDRDSLGPLAILIAIVIAGLFLGTLLLRNWLAYKVVSDAIKQPAYAFPTTQIQVPYALTPWAVPAFDPDSWNYLYSTPTPEGSGVIIINR
jgi:hypothetical protein